MLLHVNKLCVTHRTGSKRTALTRDISFTLKRNQCLGIVGESGSGKSITCAAINGLLGPHFEVSGEVWLNGMDLLTLGARERRRLRGRRICMILQSPMTAFDPLFTIGNHVVETLVAPLKLAPAETLEVMADAFRRVHLKDATAIFNKYPHELSGGMLQRVMVALALVMRPEIIIADEPTTAIDYISQMEVIRELLAVREQANTALLFISHDLSLVSHVADKVIVLKAGEIVERGKTAEVFCGPKHPYTRYLIDTRRRVANRFNQVMEVDCAA